MWKLNNFALFGMENKRVEFGIGIKRDQKDKVRLYKMKYHPLSFI